MSIAIIDGDLAYPIVIEKPPEIALINAITITPLKVPGIETNMDVCLRQRYGALFFAKYVSTLVFKIYR